MSIPWLTGATFELFSTFVSKGVDKVPDHWFEKLPVVGKFYHHSIDDPKPTTPDERYRRTKDRKSRHRHSSHHEDNPPFDDRSYYSDAGHHGRKKKSSRSSTRKSTRAASDGGFSGDGGGTGTPRAYNPADYAFNSKLESAPPKQFDHGMIPTNQQPHGLLSPSGPLPAGYVPYADVYHGRRGGGSQPMLSPTTPQPFSPQPTPAEMRNSQSSSPHPDGQMMQQSQAISNQGYLAPDSATNAYPGMPLSYTPGKTQEPINYYSSSEEGSNSTIGKARQPRQSSGSSRRSSRTVSRTRRSRIDSFADFGAERSGRDKKKAAALAAGTAIGGLVGKRMGGLPGALVGLASGYGLAKSMTKDRAPLEY